MDTQKLIKKRDKKARKEKEAKPASDSEPEPTPQIEQSTPATAGQTKSESKYPLLLTP